MKSIFSGKVTGIVTMYRRHLAAVACTSLPQLPPGSVASPVMARALCTPQKYLDNYGWIGYGTMRGTNICTVEDGISQRFLGAGACSSSAVT